MVLEQTASISQRIPISSKELPRRKKQFYNGLPKG